MSEGVVTHDHDAVADHVLEAWRRALNVVEIDDEDDFFELGGNSILVTRIVSYLRRELLVEVDMLQLFDTSAFGEFRSAVDALVAQSNGAGQ